ncbi:DDE_3 domain-containing protein [Trichonephila clavipes]|nr:DDE_3 domain-containing protein [Trichonephila clavipes]
MVWGGIGASCKTFLVFVKEGVKINQKVSQRDILVLPWAQKHFENANWTFKQDSALAHEAKKAQEWCKVNFPDTSSEEWPPNSLDLNPMDYSVWSILERERESPWPSLNRTHTHNFGLSKAIASVGMG